MADDTSNPEAHRYTMTEGHLEVQAVKEAAREVSNAIITLNTIIQNLHNNSSTRLAADQEQLIRNNLDIVDTRITRFPDKLTTVILKWRAEIDKAWAYQQQLAMVMADVEARRRSFMARESELVADAEAFERNKTRADAKMKEGLGLLRTAQAKEKHLVARERRLVNSEEHEKFLGMVADTNSALEAGSAGDVAVTSESSSKSGVDIRVNSRAGSERPGEIPERSVIATANDPVGPERTGEVPEEIQAFVNLDLNRGADAALEDAAEADAVVARRLERQTSLPGSPAPALEHGGPRSDFAEPSEGVLREEKLWHREIVVVPKEISLQARENDIVRREELMEQMIETQTTIMEKCKAQVENIFAEFQAGQEGTRTASTNMIALQAGIEETRVKVEQMGEKFRTMVALKATIEGVQAHVGNLIKEARGLTGVGGGDEGQGQAGDGGASGKDEDEGEDGGVDVGHEAGGESKDEGAEDGDERARMKCLESSRFQGAMSRFSLGSLCMSPVDGRCCLAWMKTYGSFPFVVL